MSTRTRRDSSYPGSWVALNGIFIPARIIVAFVAGTSTVVVIRSSCSEQSSRIRCARAFAFVTVLTCGADMTASRAANVEPVEDRQRLIVNPSQLRMTPE